MKTQCTMIEHQWFLPWTFLTSPPLYRTPLPSPKPDHAAFPAPQTGPSVPLPEAALHCGPVCCALDEHSYTSSLLSEEWTNRPPLHPSQQVPGLLWNQLVSQVYERASVLWVMGPTPFSRCLQCKERFLCPVWRATGRYAPHRPQATWIQPGTGRHWPENLQEGHWSTSLRPHPGHVQDRICTTQWRRSALDAWCSGGLVWPGPLPFAETAGQDSPEICGD